MFKLVTIAGALTEGLVTPQTPFRLPPCIQVADKCIHDAELRGTETLTVAKILSYSSNVGAITVAEKLGAPDLVKWIERFGFGKPTGLDFPGESGGIVPSYPDGWSGTTIGNVPIGQGIAVTPIQIASAYAPSRTAACGFSLISSSASAAAHCAASSTEESSLPPSIGS